MAEIIICIFVIQITFDRELMMDLMWIYDHSPIAVQNLLVSLKGYSQKRIRFGKVYHEYLAELKSRDYSDRSFFIDYQNRKLRELIAYAVKKSPFYAEFYKGININEIQTTADLPKLPILEKSILRENINQVYTISRSAGFESSTSGTTGTSMRVLYRYEDIQRRLAYLDFFKYQYGFIHHKMRRASISSPKIVPNNQKCNIFWRDNYSIKQRIYSAYYCQGKNIPYYVQSIKDYRPQSIDGYPSAIFLMARYILDNHIDLCFSPLAIFPTAETLYDYQKETIEKAFQCPVCDQYSSSEGAPFINECKAGHKHYCMDTGIIESDPTTNDMLITSFDSFGTPLIRYRIGDRAIFSKENVCSCGCCFPIIEKLMGRSQDYLESRTRGRFTEVFFSFTSNLFGSSIVTIQFVQNSLDKIDVYIVTDKGYGKAQEDVIKYKLHYTFGDDTQFEFHYIDSPLTTKNGKFRLIFNNIAS